MKVVYIAGPYTGFSNLQTKQHIQRAENLAMQVWQLADCCAICPHLNTAFWDGLISWEDFLQGDLAIIERCDALLLVDGWRKSKGTRKEVDHAERHGIPVFHNIKSLEKWLS